ncbi:hypothetical protein BD560DRAFT_421954 [Blakeslea trispora]|nr:hypothetical protein BD560DRAFT_421954 [Blakeslea trispora]
MNTTLPKRKKRFLTRTIPDEPTTPPLTRKKRRQLNTPLISLDLIPPSPPSPPSRSLPISTQKRSLRAASEAIAKREKERDTTKKVIKKKRKLHSQKVVLPTSDDLDETGDVSYSAYLEQELPMPVSPADPNKPTIVVGLPTKRRKLTTNQPSQTPLDLSQHAILPHLPSPSLEEEEETNSFMSDPIVEESQTISDPIAEKIQTIVIPDLIAEESQSIVISDAIAEESQAMILSDPVMEETQSIVISDAIVEEDQSTLMSDPIMEETQSIVISDNVPYSEEEDGPIFFDAMNDFEDMTISEEQREKILNYTPEEQQQHQKSTGGFWSMFFKPFSL